MASSKKAHTTMIAMPYDKSKNCWASTITLPAALRVRAWQARTWSGVHWRPYLTHEAAFTDKPWTYAHANFLRRWKPKPLRWQAII